ncbi:MAG: ATP-binding protein [Desulfobulbaceae bacterium]|nr:ATP-binding protein [Desulfobulbaceae bacterium]
MKISTRLFLYISTLLILTSIGFGYLSVRDERLHLMESTKMTARTLARTLAATFKYYHMEDQHQRLGELIHAVLPHDDHVENLLLNIYDRRGQRINLTFEHGADKQVLRQDGGPGTLLQGRRERIIKNGAHEYFSVASPIVDSGGEFQGTVEVLLSLDSVNATLAALMRKFIAFILFTSLLLGILIYLVSRWNITYPISRLKEASEKLGRGDLGLRIEKSGVKELDDLIEEFNRMALNLERQNSKREALFKEKINLERGLRHQDKLASIGRLASGLAHEIGTPLNVISGRAEHLVQKLAADHPDVKNLNIIIRQADRIAATVQQMLAFSRKPSARFKTVSPAKIIDDAFSLCRLKQRADYPKIELESQLSVRNLMADEDGLRQLFVNLMLNSFHAMPSGGTIRITSQEIHTAAGDVRIIYEDTGPGIPADITDRIFDPFFTTKEVGEGTGLGLFMVANIVQEHQGRIHLDEEVEVGVRFIIELPGRPAATTGQQNSMEKHTSSAPTKNL